MPSKKNRQNKNKNRNKKQRRQTNKNQGNQGKKAKMYSKIGGQIGSLLPIPYGKTIGKYAGKFFGPILAKLTGNGDYKMNVNPLVRNTLIQDNVPMTFAKSGTVTISHREYLGDIISSSSAGSFAYNTYLINPGNTQCFPWLSQIAPNFESYRFHGLIFEFKSMSANALNSTNTALGQVIMSTQYDAGNAAFTDKVNQEQYENTISFRPCESGVFGIECAPKMNVLDQLYVDSSTLPVTTPIQMVDLGQFQISTNGLQGTSVNVGELWVTYQVELIHPKASMGHDTQFYMGYFNSFDANVLFKTDPIQSYSGTASTTRTSSVSLKISNLVPGRFLICLNGVGTVTTGISSMSLSNGSVLTAWQGKTATAAYSASATTMTYAYIIDIYDYYQTLTFSGFTGILTKLDFALVQVPDGPQLTFKDRLNNNQLQTNNNQKALSINQIKSIMKDYLLELDNNQNDIEVVRETSLERKTNNDSNFRKFLKY